MSYYLKKISAKNFNVFKEVEFDFDDNVNYLLSGENLDDKGQKRNGVGKSTFLQIIAGGIIGNTIDENSLKDYVGPFDKKGEIKLVFENQRQKETLEINRVFSKSDSELVVLINGEAPKNIPTKQGTDGLAIDPGNEFILNHLEVTKEEILSFYLLSRRYYNSFLASTPAQMTKTLNFIVNKDDVEEAMKKLNKQISDANVEASSMQMSIQGLTASMEQYDQRMLVLQQEEDTHNNNIPHADRRQASINYAEQSVTNLMDQIARVQVPNNLPELETRKREAESIRIQIQTQKSSFESQRNSVATCPSCAHRFSIVSNITPEQIEAKVAELSNMCSIADQEIVRVQTEITKVSDAQKKINELNDLVNKNEAFILKEKRALEEAKTLDNSGKIAEVLKSKEAALSQIEEMSAKAKTLVDQSAEMQDDYKKLDEFKFYLANKPIQQICSLTNHFLNKFNTDISMTIQGFRQNADGKMVAKLNPIAQMGDGMPKKFKLFSEGQRARMQVANDIAFINILNSSKPKGGLSLYVSDEVSNGLDEVGVELICKSLQSAGLSSILVSHTANNLLVENEIKLVKENGVTFIKDN